MGYVLLAAAGSSGRISRVLCFAPVQAFPPVCLPSCIKAQPLVGKKNRTSNQLVLLTSLTNMQSFALVTLLGALFTTGVTAGPFKRYE